MHVHVDDVLPHCGLPCHRGVHASQRRRRFGGVGGIGSGWDAVAGGSAIGTVGYGVDGSWESVGPGRPASEAPNTTPNVSTAPFSIGVLLSAVLPNLITVPIGAQWVTANASNTVSLREFKLSSDGM